MMLATRTINSLLVTAIVVAAVALLLAGMWFCVWLFTRWCRRQAASLKECSLTSAATFHIAIWARIASGLVSAMLVGLCISVGIGIQTRYSRGGMLGAAIIAAAFMLIGIAHQCAMTKERVVVSADGTITYYTHAGVTTFPASRIIYADIHQGKIVIVLRNARSVKIPCTLAKSYRLLATIWRTCKQASA